MNSIIMEENGDPAISLNNVLHKINTDGLIVGMIHKIIQENDKKEEITQIFYFKGAVHTARGFSIFSEENQITKFLAFKTIIDMIPLLNQMIESIPVLQIGNQNNYTIVYRVTENKILPIIKTSIGYQALKQCMEILEENDDNIIEYMEQ